MYSKNLRNLILSMLSADRTKRPTVYDLAKHDTFAPYIVPPKTLKVPEDEYSGEITDRLFTGLGTTPLLIDL